MAFPFLALALAGAGLGAGGSLFFNKMAQDKIDSARSRAVQDENLRQERLIEQARQSQLESEVPFEEAEERQQMEESALLGSLRNARPPLAPPAPNIAPAAPGIVSGVAAGEAQRSRASTNQQAQAMAAMRGLGQFLFEARREGLRPAENIAQLSGSMQRSAGILPLELEAANQKGQSLKAIADLFGVGRDIGIGLSAGGLANSLFGQAAPSIVRSSTMMKPLAGGAFNPARFVPGGRI